MKKIFILIPAALFLFFLTLAAFGRSPEPVSVQTDPLPTLEPAAAHTVPSTEPSLPEFQRTALPYTFDDGLFVEKMFFPVQDSTPPNQELQKYALDHVEISGNKIILRANELDDGYASGKVESMFAFRYGSITMRVKHMANPGLFPAIWMLPVSGEQFPELDIYEHIGREPTTFYSVIHYQNGARDYESQHFQYLFDNTQQIPASYLLRFEWTEDSATWYLDGKKIGTMTEHIPQEPMYLILNLAVGGEWCGNPNSTTWFPTSFDVEFLDFQPREVYTR